MQGHDVITLRPTLQPPYAPRAGKAQRVGERGSRPAAAVGESRGGLGPVRAWRRGECLTPEYCGAGGLVTPAYPRPGGRTQLGVPSRSRGGPGRLGLPREQRGGNLRAQARPAEGTESGTPRPRTLRALLWRDPVLAPVAHGETEAWATTPAPSTVSGGRLGEGDGTRASPKRRFRKADRRGF